MEHFLATLDSAGDALLVSPRPGEPSKLAVLPGTVAETRPFYRSSWFWAVSATALVGLGVGGWYAYQSATQLPRHDLGPYQVP